MPFLDGFEYRDGELYCGSAPVAELLAGHSTPLYCYNYDAVVETYRTYASAFEPLNHRACFAVKAHSNIHLLALLSHAGCGLDVNSRGELHRALHAGAPPNTITMTGVGKTLADISAGLDAGILAFNCESLDECARIDAAAVERGKTADILLRINPDVNAETHPYIATGLSEHKFGIGLPEMEAAIPVIAAMKHLRIVGIGMHLGSQLFDIDAYEEGMQVLTDVALRLRSEHGIAVSYIDFGGGMGVAYDASTTAFPLGDLARRTAGALRQLDWDVTLLSEPGRFLTANAGILLTRVEYVKTNAGKTFVITDAGMNDLLRPALYQAHHEIIPVHRHPERPDITADIVGPVCESGDTFATQRSIEEVRPGEYLAIASAGAYGAAMSSRYNSRPFAAEAALIGSVFRTVRRAESLDDMIALER